MLQGRHYLITGTRDYVSLLGKGDFADADADSFRLAGEVLLLWPEWSQWQDYVAVIDFQGL